MATSGSFNTNAYADRYLTLEWYVKSQSVTNNTTTISWTLKGAGGSTTRWYYTSDFKVLINDAQVYYYASSIQLYNGTVVASGEYTINHNNDGTGSIDASAEASIYVSYVNVSGSGSWDLPTIARASQPSINTYPNNSPNFNIGDTIRIHMNRVSNQFTHNVYFEMGEATYTVAEGVTDNCTLDTSLSVISQSLYQLSANSKSYTNVVKVDTYNGSTKIGTKTCQYIANVTNSEPTFDVAYQDTNSTTLAITNNNQQIIRNNSTLQINVTNAESKNYATLRRVGVVIEGVGTYAEITGTSVNVNIGTLNLARDTDITVSLLDSRGFTTTKTITLTILDWVLPTAIITMNRVNNFYSETNINVDASYSSLDSKNSITIEYRIKKTTDSTWGAYSTLQDNVQSQFTADNLYEWDVQVRVSDRIGSATYNLPLGKGIPILFIDRLLRSLGIDCFPTIPSSLEINGSEAITRKTQYNYSLNETIIGTWIDGKPLYQKTVYIPSLPSSAGQQTYSTGVTNMKQCVNLFGFTNNGFPINLSRPNAQQFGIGAFCDATNGSITIEVGMNRSSWNGYITIQYTKTTD